MRGSGAIRLGAVWSGFSPVLGEYLTLDAGTEKLGFKFLADRTAEVDGVAICIGLHGDLSSTNWKLEIQTDNAGQPSGTVLGAATAEFTITSSDWQSLKALGAGTGPLTLNEAYWVVLYKSSGTDPDGTNYLMPLGTGAANNFVDRTGGDGGLTAHYSGAAWAVHPMCGVMALRHGSEYSGWPIDSGQGLNTTTWGTYREAVSWSLGCDHYVVGAQFWLCRVGTPPQMDIEIWSGDNLLATLACPYSKVVVFGASAYGSYNLITILASSKIRIPAGATAYMVQHVNGDGGDGGNYYRQPTFKIKTEYFRAMIPTSLNFLTGTNSTPSGLTVSTNLYPVYMGPLVEFGSDLASTVVGAFPPAFVRG